MFDLSVRFSDSTQNLSGKKSAQEEQQSQGLNNAYPSLQLAVHALDIGLLLKQSSDTLNESVCTSLHPKILYGTSANMLKVRVQTALDISYEHILKDGRKISYRICENNLYTNRLPVHLKLCI
jgi:hypothetical protein